MPIQSLRLTGYRQDNGLQVSTQDAYRDRSFLLSFKPPKKPSTGWRLCMSVLPGALNQALKQYLKDRVEPDAEQRAMFRYPELRLTYQCHGEVPQTTRAYAKVQLPGTYSVTVTHPSAFRKYLLSNWCR